MSEHVDDPIIGWEGSVQNPSNNQGDVDAMKERGEPWFEWGNASVGRDEGLDTLDGTGGSGPVVDEGLPGQIPAPGTPDLTAPTSKL